MPESYTIYNLAQDCGVSVATVSRVINGSEKVSAKTRQKVQEAMKRHNYTPNVFARGMNKMGTRIIAVFISDIANPFFADIVKGIDEACRKHEYRIILSITNNDMEQERKELELMEQKQVDGFIICGSRPVNDTNEDFIRKISARHPVIMVNARIDGGDKLYSVLVNEKQASIDALRKALSKGYKSLYLIGDKSWRTTIEKIEACEQASREFNLSFDDSHFIFCPHSLNDGRNAAVKFLALDPDLPSLAFCVSDRIAIGMLKEFLSREIAIGKDVGLLGFSNMIVTELVTPGITTVDQKMYSLGVQAADLFISIQNGIPLSEKTFYSDYELVERETV